MKNTIYIFIACMMLAHIKLSAQDHHEVIAKVYYGFKHIDDTTQKDNPYQEDIVVYLSHEASLQKSVAALSLKKAVDDFVYNPNPQVNASGAVVMNAPKVTQDISIFEYYYNKGSREFYLLNNIYDTFYIIPEEIPAIDWELLEEQKEIGGYACQRARGYFAGRTYYAWFTMEIPFSIGPWKLHGLPGLILEAADEKEEVVWSYAGFEPSESDPPEQITLPKNASKTTKARFERLYEAARRNPQGALKAAQEAAKGAGRFGLDMYNMYLTGYTLGQSKKDGYQPKNINNPLELDK